MGTMRLVRWRGPGRKGLECQVERLGLCSGALGSHGWAMSRVEVESVWGIERPLRGGVGTDWRRKTGGWRPSRRLG